MRLSARWLMLVCLSFGACSDDENGQSEDAVTSSDASTSESDKDSADSKKSSSSTKAGTGKASAGAGGSKSASGEKGSAPDTKGDDAKKDESAKADSKDSNGENKDSKDEQKESEGDKGKESDTPAGSDSPGGTDSDKPQQNEGMSTSPATPATPATPAMTGDQLALCARTEGDCNQGLACHAPAGPFSAGRGYCSKICREDADCSSLAPEGTKYTCSTGPGTSTCEVACSGADDKSCPSGLVCVQTGARRRAVVASDAGMPESTGDAGVARAPAFEPVYGCRHGFETSKIWGPCGDATHVCGEGLRCAATFWFGAGHCTRACETDADCEKAESGSAKPSCATLVPAFGDTPAVKQCTLSCAEAKDGCPTGLACFEGPETRSMEGAEPAPAFAFCQ